VTLVGGGPPDAGDCLGLTWLLCQTGPLVLLKCASNYIKTLTLFYIETQNMFAPFEYT
jgi:hypothetical protein